MERLYAKAQSLDTLIRVNQDIIDANEQETFTLQEFRQLILDYRSQNKDFLLARICTSDNPDNEQHHFYYTASEVNKILFKYETERRLLHRMKVRNPLNNLFVVGQVFYYKVSVAEVDRAINEYYENELNNSIGFTNFLKSTSFSTSEFNDDESSKKGNLNNKNLNLIENNEKNKSKPENSGIGKPENIDIEKNKMKKSLDLLSKNQYTTSQLNKSQSSHCSFNSNSNEMVQSVNGSCQFLNIRGRLIYNAEYFATDDDFLMNSEVRDYFRKNCIDDTDDFLFELDRAHTDIFALLESGSDDENEDINEWKRILSFHVSLLMALFGIMLLLGANPLIFIIAAPVIILIFMSFMCSLMYITCCRRASFNTLAVRSVEEQF
ncbi:hypothetical protein DMUE_2837 [Dictyocoela muelleri]|nr:hypothetical protein DMUE_2837 [Dictyocoela muelleri]